jgi:hypothetical protein
VPRLGAQQIGKLVNIIEGPLQGLNAVVTHLLSAKERIRVLLEFLGQSVEDGDRESILWCNALTIHGSKPTAYEGLCRYPMF